MNGKVDELFHQIQDAKKALGKRLVILGHHYQKNSVICHADFRGDSLRLAQWAAKEKDAEYIVFCGVHFMAETADILSGEHQKVILPDLNAGCSMADMADLDDVLFAYNELRSHYDNKIVPVTYVNSTAEVKAFCGRHGGMTTTSSNADKVLAHALANDQMVLFLPDQHLGRNTAHRLGIRDEEIFLWDPSNHQLELPKNPPRIILWKGECCVHQTFGPKHVLKVKSDNPQMSVIVHPECDQRVVELSDFCGSTDYIIKKITEAPDGSEWAVGTEYNLINRLAQQYPQKKIISLNEKPSLCRTMNRIDPILLLQILEGLTRDEVINQIKVESQVAQEAKIALERMLALS